MGFVVVEWEKKIVVVMEELRVGENWRRKIVIVDLVIELGVKLMKLGSGRCCGDEFEGSEGDG